jgi:UPF0755 protein
MSERWTTPSERDEERYARIRRLREQREAPMRRQRAFQPVLIAFWFAGVLTLLVVLIWIGFLQVFSPRLMAWVEEHPGAVEHGLVVDFVEWYRPEALADAPASEVDDRITVEVPLGVSATQIGRQLFEAGLVPSELAFQFAVLQAGREASLEAGVYDLSPTMTPSEIVAALRNEAGPPVDITITEGLRLEEVTAYLATTDLTMNIDQFAELVRTPPPELVAQFPALADLRVERSLEGYLAPETYLGLDANWSAEEVVTFLVDQFDQQLTDELRQQIGTQGLTIDEAVTVASIVEREAVVEAERPFIAGVYMNRLKTDGWRLDADPTLQYGLSTSRYRDSPVDDWGSIDWWPPLEVGGADLELPEDLACFQTYRTDQNAELSDKLPCSPIASPRISSIAAVAQPQGDYFFFVAACPGGVRDGSHYFAATLPEHDANIAQAAAECPVP